MRHATLRDGRVAFFSTLSVLARAIMVYAHAKGTTP